MLTFLIEETTRFKSSLQWVAKEIDKLLTLFPATNETAMAAEEAPDTMQ